jgi:uncharacterized protein (TIGR02284 family)
MKPTGRRAPTGVLSDLIRTCEQAERSFRSSARRLQDPMLGRLLESYAEQLGAFGQELRRELGPLARVSERAVEPRLDAERRSHKIPELSAHEGTIIAQCARREQALVHAYEMAVAWGLAGRAGAAVERQHLQVKDAEEHLQTLAQAGLA